jgi:acetoin utilization protein AcuB
MSSIKNAIQLNVEEFTSPCPSSVTRDTPVPEIIDMMRKEGFRHVPVVHQRQAIGIISDRDIKVFSNPKKYGSALVEEGGEITGIFTSTDALNALIEVLRGEFDA